MIVRLIFSQPMQLVSQLMWSHIGMAMAAAVLIKIVWPLAPWFICDCAFFCGLAVLPVGFTAYHLSDLWQA
jgi:hypothetical protein